MAKGGDMHGEGGHAWQRGGMHGKGGHAWQRGGMHGEGGACMAGSLHGRGHVWQGGVRGKGACVAGETATAADGTHPTGMHCYCQMRLAMIPCVC